MYVHPAKELSSMNEIIDTAGSSGMFGQDSTFVCYANNNDATLPADFHYTPVNIAGPRMNLNPSEVVYSGCSCAAPSCGKECPCIQRFGPNYTKDGKVILQTCVPTKDKTTCIISQPVIECNSTCKCGDKCINRVVQNGLQFQLQVFKTATKGWGLRTVERIPQNSFVCEYAGEILTYEQAKQRTEALSRDDMNYILVVRESLSDGKVIRTYIDPAHSGNAGRFINHSCEPNLFQVIVRVDNEIPMVGLFAARDIEPLEELSYSYWGDTDKGQITNHPTSELQKPCQCQSAVCTGFLPVDDSLF